MTPPDRSSSIEKLPGLAVLDASDPEDIEKLDNAALRVMVVAGLPNASRRALLMVVRAMVLNEGDSPL